MVMVSIATSIHCHKCTCFSSQVESIIQNQPFQDFQVLLVEITYLCVPSKNSLVTITIFVANPSEGL